MSIVVKFQTKFISKQLIRAAALYHYINDIDQMSNTRR